MTTRIRSLRLPEELDQAACDTAYVEGIPVNTLITAAVEAEIRKRRADPSFGERLRARIESDKRLLDRITDRAGEPT